MIRIVNLLEEKNQYLEKFYKINEKELIELADGRHDNIENFYAARDGILKMIEKIDSLIDEQIKLNEIDINAASGLLKKRIIKSLAYKNEIVNLVLSQDLQIISYIEQAKTELIEELSGVRKEKQAMKAYRASNKI